MNNTLLDTTTDMHIETTQKQADKLWSVWELMGDSDGMSRGLMRDTIKAVNQPDGSWSMP